MTAPDATGPAADYALLARAARGDLEALRQLAMFGISLARANDDPFALMEGLVFARLAAAVGDHTDAQFLLMALGSVSDLAHACPNQEQWADDTDAEMLIVAARLADVGAEHADRVLLGMSTATSARAALIARELVDAMPLMGGNA